MTAVGILLSGAGIGLAAHLVLTELRPPRPPKPARPARTPAPPKKRPARPAAAPEGRPAARPSAVTRPLPAQSARPSASRASAPSREAAAVRASMLESLTEVEHEVESARGWRRVTSALALLVFTLAVAGLLGMAIYRGLIALG